MGFGFAHGHKGTGMADAARRWLLARWAMQGATLSLLGFALFAVGGCQQQSGPLRLSVISDQAVPEHLNTSSDGTYVNPAWRDDDDASDNVFYEAWSATESVVGSIFNPIGEFTVQTYERMNGQGPGKADRLLEDKASADNRREGMNQLAEDGFLNNPIFRKRCREIAEHDPDSGVRATAIRTCNRAHDTQATLIFVAGLNDREHDWVRLESAKALANLPDARAADALRGITENRAENRDIRVAAVDALKHYRTLPTARVLSSALDEKNFVIAWQARRSLRYLTDRDYGYDSAAWLKYFIGPQSQLR
jgi:hypothetical protein